MKTFKTWADFAKNYDLVLFNECVNLVHKDNHNYFEAVLTEWLESHNCELEEGQEDCECEPFQWYAIGAGEWDVEHLNKEYNLDIFYSDTLGIYILPVYHFGTSWTHVNI